MDAEELSRRTTYGEGWVPHGLATLLMHLGHVDVVRRQAEEGDWFCAQALSDSLAEQGSSEEAVAVLAPFADSGWWPAVSTLADLLTSLDRLDEVVALVEPHLASDPAYPADLAAGRLARTLARLGRHEEAFEVVKPYVATRSVLVTLVTDLAGRGLDDEIAAVIEGAVADPGEFFAVGLLATFYEQQQRPDMAISLLRSRIEISGLHFLNHIEQFAETLARHGRFAEMRQFPVPRRFGADAQRLAQAYRKAGDTATAEEVLRAFIGESPEAAYHLAEILAETGRVDEAIEVLRPHALKDGAAFSCEAPALFGLLTEHGRLDEAVAFLDEIAGTGTGTGTIPFDLLGPRAELLSALGRDEEALEVLKGHPEIGHHWYGRMITAKLLCRFGRVDEAVAFLDDVEEHYQLLEILIRNGRVAEAVDRVRGWRAPTPAVEWGNGTEPPF